jgi:hypothetical protein
MSDLFRVWLRLRDGGGASGGAMGLVGTADAPPSSPGGELESCDGEQRDGKKSRDEDVEDDDSDRFHVCLVGGEIDHEGRKAAESGDEERSAVRGEKQPKSGGRGRG